MFEGTPGYPDGSGERRGFPRLSIAESIKLEVVDSPPGSPATFGSTTDISRGGLEAVIQGGLVPLRARCIVRFLATTRIKPVMAWGVVVAVDDSPTHRKVRVEFETPLEELKLTPIQQERMERRGTSVLIVDDSFPVRDVLQRFLRDKGYTVFQASDGDTGLDLLREKAPDVLILDIYMPRMNGLDVLRRMRDEGLEPRVVITISGEGDHESARESLRLGAQDFIVKPLELGYVDWAIRLRM